MKRYIVVVSAAQVAAAHKATIQPELDPKAGDQTFTVGLSADGNPPATFYWASWNMTDRQAVSIQARLKEQGATSAEVAPVPDKGLPASSKFAVFDASIWDPEKVLATLGLKRIGSTP